MSARLFSLDSVAQVLDDVRWGTGLYSMSKPESLAISSVKAASMCLS
jgi:hypothetical protein